MKNKTKNNKAQEEVMGFVIIVLIVIIIGLVFFAFSLRRADQGPEPQEAELDDFRDTMLKYTTDCEIGLKNQSIRELARQCNNYPSKTCQGNQYGKNVCDFLNEISGKILQDTLGKQAQIANAYIHGYQLNITGQNPEPLVLIEEGSQTGNFFASSTLIPTGQAQDISVKLKFYYSKEA